MKTNNQKGSAMIELLTTAPFIAAFIMIVLQFGALFTQAVHDAASAEAEAVQAINRWDLDHFQNGFKRPCLEEMQTHEIEFGGNQIPIGIGRWKINIGIPQEVRFVAEAICVTR